MRRFALLFGAGALAVTLTVAVLFGGLGLGGLLGPRLAPRMAPNRLYALLELFAAAWALTLPTLLTALTPLYREHASLGTQSLLVIVLAGPPALALGATLPVLARGLPDRSTLSGLYAANTVGATLGTLAVPALLLPVFGVAGAERAAACVGLSVAALAWTRQGLSARGPGTAEPVGWRPLLAVGLCGLTAMSLEVAWTRLGAVLLGPSIHAFAWVLAVFLAGVAAGAALERRLRWSMATGLGLFGLLALTGGLVYGSAPTLLASLFELLGPSRMGLTEALLAGLTMGGAPLASGLVFAAALRSARGEGGRATASVYGVNTLMGVLGSAATGLWLLPLLGVQGVLVAAAVLLGLGSLLLSRRPGFLLAIAALALVQPSWDGKLYAVGVYNRVSDLGDRSRSAVLEFAHEGWELVSYEDGRSAAVAVGRSTRTGNVWLSINGKVDASTGDDMPTQVLSGQVPVRMQGQARRVLVVGLASGVTAGAVLAEPGVEELVLVELEEEVVAASRHFDHVNGRPLEDPRTELRVEDARAVLSQAGPPFQVIVSEPSNPWITGVSNLFTLEYWQLGRARLGEDGLFCQWIQLYGLATSDFRSIVRSFTEVFPRTWLFEPLEGGDVLMMGALGEVELDSLPIAPVLGPEGVARLGAGAALNTDDRPRVELHAPRALHLATVEDNQAAIQAAARR
jgi:spermidine synthase